MIAFIVPQVFTAYAYMNIKALLENLLRLRLWNRPNKIRVMKEFLFFLSNFLDFWFLPFVIGLVISIIIEQILRASGNQYDPKAVKKVETATRVRKFLWRQNIILNFTWFLCYFILMFMLRGQQTPMPDMIWQG